MNASSSTNDCLSVCAWNHGWGLRWKLRSRCAARDLDECPCPEVRTHTCTRKLIRQPSLDWIFYIYINAIPTDRCSALKFNRLNCLNVQETLFNNSLLVSSRGFLCLLRYSLKNYPSANQFCCRSSMVWTNQPLTVHGVILLLCWIHRLTTLHHGTMFADLSIHELVHVITCQMWG